MLRYLSLAYQASQIAMSASNLFTLPSKPLLGYVTALLSPSYSVVSCSEVEDCSMMDMIMLGYHNISYLINASIYLVEGSALCLVFCSTLAALVSVIAVLCSWILHSLRGWVIYGTPLTVRFE